MKPLSTFLSALAVAGLCTATVLPADSALAAPKFENHGSYGVYNHYRGDRNRHEGYRYYNGFWFPPAAFVAGAIVGGLLNNGTRSYAYAPSYTYAPPTYYSPSAHISWCQAHYRSYNVNTDTFLGYDGVYHRCAAPY